MLMLPAKLKQQRITAIRGWNYGMRCLLLVELSAAYARGS